MKFSNPLYLFIISTLSLMGCGSSGGNSSQASFSTAVSLNEEKAAVQEATDNSQHDSLHIQPNQAQEIRTEVENVNVDLPQLNKLQSKENEQETPPEKIAQIEENKAELPKLNPPQIEHSLPDNQKIFNELELNYENRHWISLKLENDKITMSPLSAEIAINNAKPELQALMGKDGRLLGYYGYAQLSKTVPNPYYPDENSAEYAQLSLLAMDESQKIQPQQNLHYVGNFYYHYLNSPTQALSGRVSAYYNNDDKRLSMELFGEDNDYWELKESRKAASVNVAPDGTIFGRLWRNNQPAGEFDGAIYGKNGEILAGKAEYQDSLYPNNSWKGVVGAKSKE